MLQVVLSFALLPFFGFGGVIAAFSISYTIGAVVALATLQRRAGPFADRELALGLVRHLVAAVAMGAVLVGVVSTRRQRGCGPRRSVRSSAARSTWVSCSLLRSRELGELRNLRRPSPADPETTPKP